MTSARSVRRVRIARFPLHKDFPRGRLRGNPAADGHCSVSAPSHARTFRSKALRGQNLVMRTGCMQCVHVSTHVRSVLRNSSAKYRSEDLKSQNRDLSQPRNALPKFTAQESGPMDRTCVPLRRALAAGGGGAAGG